MRLGRVRHLPVLDEDGYLAGIRDPSAISFAMHWLKHWATVKAASGKI
jgi:hypothetical protein